MEKLIFKQLHEKAILPTRGSEFAAGLDLHSIEQFSMMTGVPFAVRTGLAVEIRKGYYGRIAPRSGLAMQGVDVLGGVIDSDYRGELMVVLIKHNVAPQNMILVNPGNRIALSKWQRLKRKAAAVRRLIEESK